jgi:hypothetical protein
MVFASPIPSHVVAEGLLSVVEICKFTVEAMQIKDAAVDSFTQAHAVAKGIRVQEE